MSEGNNFIAEANLEVFALKNNSVKDQFSFFVKKKTYKVDHAHEHEHRPAEVFYKKGVVGNFTKFTGKHLCQGPIGFIQKEALTQVFFCEFC